MRGSKIRSGGVKESSRPKLGPCFTGGLSLMLVAHLASSILVKIILAALVLLQSEGAQPFNLWQMWLHMQWPARMIAIILLGMSAWSWA